MDPGIKIITWKIFQELFLRFLSKHPRWHGTVEIKFYDGKISKMDSKDSNDLTYIDDSYLVVDTANQEIIHQGFKSIEGVNDMALIKNGAPNLQSKDSVIEEVTSFKEVMSNKDLNKKNNNNSHVKIFTEEENKKEEIINS